MATLSLIHFHLCAQDRKKAENESFKLCSEHSGEGRLKGVIEFRNI